jgi:hypothetical protein
MAQQCCILAEKSVINMIYLLLNVSDWPVIMISPAGLLLEVPHLLAVPVSVLCGVAKEYITKLGCESHTEHRWSCSSEASKFWMNHKLLNNIPDCGSKMVLGQHFCTGCEFLLKAPAID